MMRGQELKYETDHLLHLMPRLRMSGDNLHSYIIDGVYKETK
jgi:hypothetical protein